ncbi:MAG: translation initiation factor IF-2 [Bacteroidaceae bacterium]|nr:translation initiation factor IF-2 [Bacteroidaceae bacterium]MBQ5909145.1 translation initiation factor IF-2 [Bacteroidaceae bacterium]
MSVRLNIVIKECNVGLQTVVDFLHKKGVEVQPSPSAKISDEQYELIRKEFGADKDLRNKAEEMLQNRQKEKKASSQAKKAPVEEIKTVVPEEARPQIVVKGHIDLNAKPAPAPEKAPEPKPEPQPEETQKPEPKKPARPSVEERAKAIGSEDDGVFKLHSQPTVAGPKVLGTIDLSTINSNTRPKKKTKEEKRKEREEKNRQQGATGQNGERKKRNRIGKERVDVNAAANQQGGNSGRNRNKEQAQAAGQNAQGSKRSKERNRKAQQVLKPEISDEDVAKQVKETLARLTSKTKAAKGAKYRKEKREQVRAQQEEMLQEERAGSNVLKLTEFVTANELASMMDVPVTKVIGTCMSIGIMVSINQRMDAETIDLVAEEFGFKTEFISADVQEAITVEEDKEEDLEERAPIVTVMGHVDHGKTSLLDYIRKANVIAGEAGGITQHIGAYNVKLENGRHITFLDTPGHEAFTAMRARGAQVTDIAIIIIAADDSIMPQTKEAINHAVAANVPIVFAINKIDKPTANPDKIKENLAAMNFLVEEWGGKYQSQDISAKKGIGVEELLEKVLLEAEMLELKANPNRKAVGTVIESSLDKGRGYVATVLVGNGTLRQGDVVLAGTNYGRVKALFNERGQRIQEVGPSMAATLLGFNGAPQAGDQFHVMETEQEAREIANKREQLQREQDLRTQKMLTLDEVGRRIKLGSFQELNIIVKGDVDGSVEALSDSFIRLSTETIAVNVIHKGVGQISENDVTLAAASQAVIVGFQVRPSQSARRLAEKEGVEIRQYSVIYDAIEEVKEAMEGMLQPVLKEEMTATVEVRQVYHISKVGYVAGAYVMDGTVHRSDKARLIRDGIVIYTGDINALKRFKDDVKEVNTNFECGISITNCNDIKEGDIIETFREIEIKQKLQ